MSSLNWSESLFTYGPYAVTALFALYVAPRQTKQAITTVATSTGPRALAISSAALCWGVVGMMCWFIYSNWSPRVVYTGSLGSHAESTTFYPADENFYLTTRRLDNNRLKWSYAIIAQRGMPADTRFQFTYTWGESIDQSRDYVIALSRLKNGPLDISPTGNGELTWDRREGEETEPLTSLAINDSLKSVAEWFISTASAAEPVSMQWIKNLESSNPYFRAQARRYLRTLELADLRSLLVNSEVSLAATKLIEKQIKAKKMAG